MDLQGAADQLYAISPDDFVAQRTALVAEARAAKDRALAKEIGQLRRPTRSAWLVNILARAEPERVTELLELGTALQQAQQRMAGDDLRRLSKERRTMIDSLARRAGELGAEQEYAATDAAIQEVSQTLQAALGDPAVADLVRAGRIPQAVSYGGFGPADLTSALAASLPAAEPKTTPAKATPAADKDTAPEEEPPDSAEVRAAEQEATTKRQAAEEAAEASAEAESAAEAATTRADELADEVESLRARLREAEDQERTAREEARTARKRSMELRREAAAAAQDASAAQSRLDQLRDS
ncbi:MAG TPA: hypothetical protein VLJ88_04890 [Propionibacteriaceae bacterium]|nr:hypothetical protein [Propionibacteriaceae bacterium]